MNKTTVTGDIIGVFLRQLGAQEVKQVTSSLYYIVFDLKDGYEVSYVYNINFKDQYFLQRIKPYPLSRGVFHTEDEIIMFIKDDIQKFRNAAKSSNFETYLQSATKMHFLKEELERVFLTYNVDKNRMIEINQELDSLLKKLDEVKKESKLVH